MGYKHWYRDLRKWHFFLADLCRAVRSVLEKRKWLPAIRSQRFIVPFYQSFGLVRAERPLARPPSCCWAFSRE